MSNTQPLPWIPTMQEVDAIARTLKESDAKIAELEVAIAALKAERLKIGQLALDENARANEAEAENVRLQALVAEAGSWTDAKYNDIINVDNNNQIRVVIDLEKQDGKVHLHIRKRIDGEWRHVGVTTLADDWQLRRRKEATDVNE